MWGLRDFFKSGWKGQILILSLNKRVCGVKEGLNGIFVGDAFDGQGRDLLFDRVGFLWSRLYLKNQDRGNTFKRSG